MRKLIVLLAVMVAVVACGDDDATTTTAPGTTAPPSSGVTTTTTDFAVDVVISVVDKTASVTVEGILVSGRVQFTIGTRIRITVMADAADEVHVHGYDVSGDVAPGAPAVIEFTADIPGIFEVELEDAHTLLVELQIS